VTRLRSGARGSRLRIEKRLPLCSMFGSDEFLNGERGFLNHDGEWIRMDGANVALKSGRNRGQFRRRDPYLGRVKVINQAANVSGKIVMDAMNVFTHINAPGTKIGKRFLQGDNLLFRTVTTVIDHDV